jgi:hypothetical protein
VSDWRKRSQHRVLLLEDLILRMDREAPADPERALAARDRERVLSEAMEELDEGHREVLALHLEDMKMTEIAEVLGISVGAGYARLERAHAKLDAALRRRRAGESAGVAVPLVAFLDALREDQDPGPDSSQGRIWRRLQEGADDAAVPARGAPRGLGAAARRVLARHGPGFLTGGTVVGIIALLLRGSPEPAHAEDLIPATATASVIAAQGSPPLPTLPEVTTASANAPLGLRPPVASFAASPRHETAGRHAEEWLISAAFEDLGSGRTERAIRWLDEAAQRFPDGEMRARREELLAQARCAGR